jgi:hypothetical protein
MTTQIFIEKFLDIEQPMENNPVRFSTMALLVKSARKLSGRNLLTGIYEMKELNESNFTDQTYHPFMFTGLINYLIFLEQIGSIFKPKAATKIKQTNGIYCALEYFSLLDNDKKSAVKALRNTLTHKFGLATENKESDKYRFQLSIERNSEIIIPKNWDGNFSTKTDDTLTTVHIIDLADFVETIYVNILESWKAQTLELVVKEGIDEVKSRYTIIY